MLQHNRLSAALLSLLLVAPPATGQESRESSEAPLPGISTTSMTERDTDTPESLAELVEVLSERFIEAQKSGIAPAPNTTEVLLALCQEPLTERPEDQVIVQTALRCLGERLRTEHADTVGDEAISALVHGAPHAHAPRGDDRSAVSRALRDNPILIKELLQFLEGRTQESLRQLNITREKHTLDWVALSEGHDGHMSARATSVDLLDHVITSESDRAAHYLRTIRTEVSHFKNYPSDVPRAEDALFLAARLERTASKSDFARLRADLESLREAPWFSALPLSSQNGLLRGTLQRLRQDPATTPTESILSLLDPSRSGLSPQETRQITDLLASVSDELCCDALLRYLDVLARTNTVDELFSPDQNKIPLITHLRELARSEPRAGIDRDEILRQTFEMLTCVFASLDQGEAGTCATIPCLAALTIAYPSDLVRLVRDTISPVARFELLPLKESATHPATSETALKKRPSLNALLQSKLMEDADPDKTYIPAEDVMLDRYGNETIGMSSDDIIGLLNTLTSGERFIFLSRDNHSAAELIQTLSDCPSPFRVAILDWSTELHAVWTLDTNLNPADPDGGEIMIFNTHNEGVNSGGLEIRDEHLPNPGPTRRVIDPANCLVTISRSEVEKRLEGIIIPAPNPQSRFPDWNHTNVNRHAFVAMNYQFPRATMRPPPIRTLRREMETPSE